MVYMAKKLCHNTTITLEFGRNMAIQTINDFRAAIIEELDSLMFIHAISAYTHTKAIREVQDFHGFDMYDMSVTEATDIALAHIGVRI